MEYPKLRTSADFKNKSSVEYATIRVEIPHRLVPSNLQDGHYRDDDVVTGLYATPTGRLSYKTLYLDSKELAEHFADYLRSLFKNRPYAAEFELKVEVLTTTQTVTSTKGKLKHSAIVLQTLSSSS